MKEAVYFMVVLPGPECNVLFRGGKWCTFRCIVQYLSGEWRLLLRFALVQVAAEAEKKGATARPVGFKCSNAVWRAATPKNGPPNWNTNMGSNYTYASVICSQPGENTALVSAVKEVSLQDHPDPKLGDVFKFGQSTDVSDKEQRGMIR
eukprot:478467-Rhodomonas_salina.1